MLPPTREEEEEEEEEEQQDDGSGQMIRVEDDSVGRGLRRVFTVAERKHEKKKKKKEPLLNFTVMTRKNKRTRQSVSRVEVATLDCKALRLFTREGALLSSVATNRQAGLRLLSLCYHARWQVYLAASTDMSIRVMSHENGELLGRMIVDKHVVQRLAYTRPTNQVLTAGSLGLRAYALVQQPLASGRGNTRWMLQLVRAYSCSPFATSLRYHEATDCAVVLWPQTGSVDVFDAGGSSCTRLSSSLHAGSVLTDALRARRAYNFVTCCAAGLIKAWYQDLDDGGDEQVRHLYTFRGHSRSVTRLETHPSRRALFISISTDGSVRVWNLDDLVCVDVFQTNEPLFDLDFEDGILVVATPKGKVMGFSFEEQGDDEELELELEEEEEEEELESEDEVESELRVAAARRRVSFVPAAVVETIETVTVETPEARKAEAATELDGARELGELDDARSDEAMRATLERAREARRRDAATRFNPRNITRQAAERLVGEVLGGALAAFAALQRQHQRQHDHPRVSSAADHHANDHALFELDKAVARAPEEATPAAAASPPPKQQPASRGARTAFRFSSQLSQGSRIGDREPLTFTQPPQRPSGVVGGFMPPSTEKVGFVMKRAKMRKREWRTLPSLINK